MEQSPYHNKNLKCREQAVDRLVMVHHNIPCSMSISSFSSSASHFGGVLDKENGYHKEYKMVTLNYFFNNWVSALPNKVVLVDPVFTCNYIVYNAKNITVCDSCIYLLKLTATTYDIYACGYILIIVIDNTCSIYLKLCIGNLGASIV